MNKFTIVDKKYISYYGGYAQVIFNGKYTFHIWENKEDTNELCNILNNLIEQSKENVKLKKKINELRMVE